MIKNSILIFGLLIMTLSVFSCKERTNQSKAAEEKESSLDVAETPESITKGGSKEAYIIKAEGIMGLEVGRPIDKNSKYLIAAVQHNGEGSFEGYQLIDDNAEEIGFVFPSPNDDNIIGLIEITSPKMKTADNLTVGSTFEELKRIYPNIEIHGNEIEGRTSGEFEGISYLLDSYNSSYEIEEPKIDPSTEIRSISILGTEPRYYDEENTGVDHYICYTNDNATSKRIWISFDENGKALQVKYERQNEPISLSFDKEEYREGGAYPTIVEYYNEIYEGNFNGRYELTHSGNWDYVKYTRGKDDKVFNFTIDHNAAPYGNQPCF